MPVQLRLLTQKVITMSIILADKAVPYSSVDLFKQLGITIISPVEKVGKLTQPKAPERQSDAAGLASSTIFEGNRNNTLCRLAGTMRRSGLGEEAIRAGLVAANNTQVNPPLPESEVEQIALSIMRYEPAEDATPVLQTLNDIGNAARFVDMHQVILRYVLGMEQWMIWQDHRWIIDNYGVHVMALAKMTVENIFQEAALQPSVEILQLVHKHAANSHHVARLKAMQEIASRDPIICVPVKELDSNPMLLGVANGVVNLITGKLEPNHPDKLITRYSGVRYDGRAGCPNFRKFLKKIFKGDKEKVEFVRRLIGYCLTGLTDEHAYFFFFGFGANGKSTLLRVIELLLGHEMAKQTPAETLMAKVQGTKQSNDLARLLGVRVVIANEIEDGSQLAESLVKQITGGDTVTARFLYKEYFEYRPEYKLIFAGNHKPIIKGTDNGIWRRTVMVDFPVSIPKEEQDPDLPNKLEAELSGILNWAIAGCLEWQKIGLAIPASVTQDITEYRKEMDWLGQWMADCCTVGDNLEERASALYLSYEVWAKQNGIYPATSTTFGRRLAERGITKKRRADTNWYKGLKVKPEM